MRLPGRVRRALDGSVDSTRRFGDTIEVAPDGRLESRLAKGGGLKMTREGLMLDLKLAGEKNRPQLNNVRELAPTATTADLIVKMNELLKESMRTGNMKGGVT